MSEQEIRDAVNAGKGPSFRPDRRLSNPQDMGGLPFWPVLLVLVPIGALLILGIWMQTCGMGASC